MCIEALLNLIMYISELEEKGREGGQTEKGEGHGERGETGRKIEEERKS